MCWGCRAAALHPTPYILHRARAQAEFPARVFVGAVEQDKERNESCIDSTLPNFANVRVVAIPHTASKGPTYGRYLGSTMFRGEAFYLQLDSHTQLAPKWDSKLIAMLDTCDSPKPARPPSRSPPRARLQLRVCRRFGSREQAPLQGLSSKLWRHAARVDACM